MGGGLEDLNFSGNLFRVIDLEEADKETIHLLVFLLMQFMSRQDLVRSCSPITETSIKIPYFCVD